MSFTRLPLLPLLKAFGHLDDLDMLNLSFCSRRTAKLVKASNRLTFTILFDSHGETHEISVRTLMTMFTIRLDPSSRRHILPRRLLQDMAVHGTISFRGFEMRSYKPIRCHFEPSGTIFYDTREDLMVLHKTLTKHFLDLHVTSPRLNLTLAPSEILTHPFLKNWKKWDMVTISWYTGRSYVTSEEMRFLLNFSKYTNDLKIEREVENGFQYSKGFQLYIIHFSHSSWVQMDSIINSTSQYITLGKFPRPTAFQLINLLKLWIAKEKMVNLWSLSLDSDLVDSAEPIRSDEFRREIWRGIGLSRLDDAITGEIRRYDGVRARVFLRDSSFCLQKLVPCE